MTESIEADGDVATSHKTVRLAWFLLPLVVAGVAGLARWSSSEAEPAALDVTSAGPSFTTVADLAEASDLVAIGTIQSADPGRTISDPANPDAGIRTTLYQFDVDRLLAGPALEEVIIEHETALVDGTPISINGAPAPSVGERVLVFLVAGESETFPHFAIINEQGRYRIDDERIVAVAAHPLAAGIENESIDAFVGRYPSLDS